MRKLLCITALAVLLLSILPAAAQQDVIPETFDEFQSRIAAIARTRDAEAAQQLADALFDALEAAERIPFVAEDMVAFVYRGEAQTVEWRGDFTGWEQRPGCPANV